MGMWCALDDWKPDGSAEPVGTFLPGGMFPLMWTASGPKVVPVSAPIDLTWPAVALVTHWAQEHPDQLHAFIGEFELYTGPVRTHSIQSAP